MGRMDSLLAEWERDTSRRIFVVYYGHRYRKTARYAKNGQPEAIILSYPHPDDGLNWAKGVPRYLDARAAEIAAKSSRTFNGMLDKVELIDGGYREQIEVEIWLGGDGVPPPEPTPTISKNDITFGAARAYPVPNQINCYAGY